MGVTRDMIVALLRYQPRNLIEFRNKLVTCTLCIGCMRPGEGARTTACNLNLKFDADYLKGLLDFKDCSTLVTNHRKQDQERKGHHMRFGKSDDPALDINHQLGLFMDLAPARGNPALPVVRRRTPPRLPRLRAAFPQTRQGTWILLGAPLYDTWRAFRL
jgi:hypothetical protein